MKLTFTFNDKAEAAQQEAKKQAAKLVTDITAETQLNIRSLIEQAIRDGISPYEAANTIHDLVGLTAAQGQAAMKYKQQLTKNGLDPAKVEEKAAAYADELLDVRAENIARYEVMDALNNGQNEAWAQAQDKGLLSEDAEKEWILSENACQDCQDAADSGPVAIGDEFDGGDPPLHPRCECTIGISKP